MKFVNHRNLNYADVTLTPEEVDTIRKASKIINKVLTRVDKIIDDYCDAYTPIYTCDGCEAGHYELEEALECIQIFEARNHDPVPSVHIDYGEVNTEDYIEEEEL